MLVRIRRQDNKYQKTYRVEPEGIVAASCADPAPTPMLKSLPCDYSSSWGSGFNGML